MQITRLAIRNFRSIRELDIELGQTTVFVGPNNAGKTAILDAARIILTRRWGQRGTGFTENDVHRPDETTEPRSAPPIQIELVIEEPRAEAWDGDMVAALSDVSDVLADGRNILRLRVTCQWSEEKESFDPAWEFLNAAGEPLTGAARRATNFSQFFGLLPMFWLGALRDAADEFKPRSAYWGRLLRAVRIPDEIESETLATLADLDSKVMEADPQLAEIAELTGRPPTWQWGTSQVRQS